MSEDDLEVKAAVLQRHVTTASREPALKELMRKIQSKMMTSWRLRTRYPNGEIRFLDTNYFAGKIGGTLPPEILRQPAREVDGLPEPVSQRLGRTPVGEVLELPLAELARRTDTDVAEAARTRRRLMASAARRK